MVMAKLHIICGNCGCDHMFKYTVAVETDWDKNDKEFKYVKVNVICENCSTIHSLEDNAEGEGLGAKT